MSQPAQLGARDLVVSNLCWQQMRMNLHAWDRVLLEAHGRNEKAVDDVLRPQHELDIAACGQDQCARNNVVLARPIGRINAQRVSLISSGKPLRIHAPESPVRPRITEIPLELNARNLYLYSVGNRVMRRYVGPQPIAGKMEP